MRKCSCSLSIKLMRGLIEDYATALSTQVVLTISYSEPVTFL